MSDDIAVPVGLPGSGRRRYAAAMALHAAGTISDGVLEVYRILSPRDGDDPAALLAGSGVPASSTGGEVAALIAEADRYLAGLSGPGVAEVRAGIGRWRAAAGLVAARGHPIVAAHLPGALAALAPTHPGLAAAIAAAAPGLRWGPHGTCDPAEFGDSFRLGHACASLIGVEGAVRAPDFELGLLLVAPDLLYRDHRHAAPELYVPLTGPHGWRFGAGRPLVVKPAHVPVWNAAQRLHLIKAGPVPFLSLFGKTRDVTVPSVVIPAADWGALEALRL